MSICGKMEGLHVVVVAVNNMDEAVQTYQTLGFELIERNIRETEGTAAAKFKAGGDSMIELLSPVAEDKAVAKAIRRFLDKKGEGVYEVAVRVTDISTVNNFLKKNEVRIVAEPHSRPMHPEIKVMWISPRSTHGVFLEFIEDSENTKSES